MSIRPRLRSISLLEQSTLRGRIDFVFFEEAVERLAVVFDVAAHLDVGRPLLLATPLI